MARPIDTPRTAVATLLALLFGSIWFFGQTYCVGSPMEAIDHLDLVVSSLDRGLAFYAGLLRPLGYCIRARSRVRPESDAAA